MKKRAADPRRSSVLRLSDPNWREELAAQAHPAKSVKSGSADRVEESQGGGMGYIALAAYLCLGILGSGLLPEAWLKDSLPGLLYVIVLPAVAIVVLDQILPFISWLRR